MQSISKEYVLLAIVTAIAVMLMVKTIKFPHDATVSVTIIQNKEAIASAYTKQKPLSTKKLAVDSIDFPESHILEHPSLGNLGYQSNFFLEATTMMSVNKAGDYRFRVTSDDGFRLKIDNKTVCEHPQPRAMLSTECRMTLAKKTYRFELLYYQAAGQMGLSVEYFMDDVHTYVGKDSQYLEFKEVK